MPFQSEAQRRFMFAKHKDIAERWVQEAKAKGEAVTKPVEKVGFRKHSSKDLGVNKPHDDSMKNLAVQAIKQRAKRR